MIWERLVLWGVNRGLVSGAIVGALLGAFIAFIYGALIGLFLGGIIGAFMGLVDGILLTIITHFAYTPSRYPKLVYTVTILTNSVPIFLLCGGLDFSWSVTHFPLGDTILRLILIGGIPTVIMGVITAYTAGLFLEFVDSMMGYSVYGLEKR